MGAGATACGDVYAAPKDSARGRRGSRLPASSFRRHGAHNRAVIASYASFSAFCAFQFNHWKLIGLTFANTELDGEDTQAVPSLSVKYVLNHTNCPPNAGLLACLFVHNCLH